MPARANAVVDPRFPTMLRSLRQQAGLSLRALATASSYSRSYLWDLEANHKHPSPAVAGRLDATLAAGGALAALVVANGAAPVSGGPHRSTQAYSSRRAKGQRTTRITDSRRRSRHADPGDETATNSRRRADRTVAGGDASSVRRLSGARGTSPRTVPDPRESSPGAADGTGARTAVPNQRNTPPGAADGARARSSALDPRNADGARARPTVPRRPADPPPLGTGCTPIDDAIAHWRTLARANPATMPPADPAAARINGRSRSARRWALIAEPPSRSERFDATRYAATPTTPTALTGSGTRPVTGLDIHTIRRLVATYRELDNRYGGAHVHPLLVRFLDLELAPLLAGRYDSSTGRELASVAAEAVLLAGWAAYDAGLDAVAQRHLGHALDLARRAGDRALEAETLVAMAHHCAYHGFGLPSVDLARLAGHAAADAGAHAVWAEAAAQEAHGYAIHGDAAACAQALDRAEDTIHRADRSHDVDWMRHIDLAYLKARAGVCFLALHRRDLTARYVSQLERATTPYRRAGAIRAAVAAAGYVLTGSVERACELGFEAMRTGADVRSARLVEFMVRLGEALGPHRDVPVVRDFLSRAELD